MTRKAWDAIEWAIFLHLFIPAVLVFLFGMGLGWLLWG